MKPPEAPRAARERDLAGLAREREGDVPEGDVSRAGVEDQVALQPGARGCLQVEDPRALADLLEIRVGDRAEAASLARVLRGWAVLDYMESPVPRRVVGGAG